jgi:outer membrane protein OmpA-like peptidoglycan-associated protein
MFTMASAGHPPALESERMSFCTQCGSPRVAGAAFCRVCGAALPPLAAAPLPAAAVPPPPAPAVASGGGSGLRTFLIVALVLLFVVIGLGIAGTYYAVRTAKQKAEGLLHSIAPAATSNAGAAAGTGGPLSSLVPGASSQANAPLTPSPAAFPALSSVAAPDSKDLAPLKEGMLVVTAIAEFRGDYESMKQIVSIDSGGATLTYHSNAPKAGTSAAGASNNQGETSTRRKVLAQDLKSAHDYAEVFGSNDPESYPGTTAISASQEVLAQLKQNGTSDFSFRPDGVKGALGSLVSTFSALAGADTKNVGGVSLEKLTKEQCTLHRDGNGVFAFPVLLNAQPVTLPAVRARCMTDDGPADFYILDQPDYPLMLSWKLGSGGQLQVIKITYPPAPKTTQAPASNPIEQQLREKKKVDIYGIYFDFASDRLKPESTPVLEEIAGVLKDNPAWTLTVNGHTDNVGGDPYNLDLSKRRAAAVKQALVTQYHVAPERLLTDGFGASRPVDTNDTLAGRARNRRVELTRE